MIQFSEINLRSKDLLDAWLYVLQYRHQDRDLSVCIHDDIGTDGWEALAKALKLLRLSRFESYNNVMMHARSEDLRIVWDALRENSRFLVEIRDVVTKTRLGETKVFCKYGTEADREKKWTELLKFWETTKVQAERRRRLRPRTADFNPFSCNTKPR